MTNLWRYIDDDECEPYYNMALDEAISICVREGISPPTLRIYNWHIPSVSIGYFQKINDIDYEYCKKNNIPVVRRPTGGRAILHERDITYSINVNKDSEVFSCNLFESYKRIGDAFYNAFLVSNIDAKIRYERQDDRRLKGPYCFQAISYAEIMYNGHKIMGSAQKRWVNGFIQQGCIPFFIDKNKLQNIFRLDKDYIKNILTINDIASELSIEEMKWNIVKSFEKVLGIKFSIEEPKREELNIAGELIKNKYMTDEWNYTR